MSGAQRPRGRLLLIGADATAISLTTVSRSLPGALAGVRCFEHLQLAGALHHADLVNRLALLGCLFVAGCFYVTPINQRPSIDILQLTEGELHRGDVVALAAVADDPEGHTVSFQWRVYACTSAELAPDGSRPGCDAEPFHTEAALDTTEFVVPASRTSAAVPPEVLLVLLEGRDAYGATARPIQQLALTIVNQDPELALAMRSRYGYVVGTAIELYARVSDPDDGAASTQPLTWTVYPPSGQPAYSLEELDVPDPDAPAVLQLGKTFRAGAAGSWEVEVEARDPLGGRATARLVVLVTEDRPPCLAQWAPVAARAPSALPLTAPTLFGVTLVDDDLDPFPTVPGDPELGATTFAWSLRAPGASTFAALAADGNQLVLDPAAYAPGDVVELRVEISDRVGVATTCDPALPTCSVISDDGCIQRQTWRVEVR